MGFHVVTEPAFVPKFTLLTSVNRRTEFFLLFELGGVYLFICLAFLMP